MSDDMARCLNCGAALGGPFCAQCGQRAVPPYPTIAEYAGDAWDEFSGLDGRLVRTLVTLFAVPGRLTLESLEGRRQQYVKPLRLYLVASLIYFVVAAAAPNVTRSGQVVLPGQERVMINITDARGVEQLTPEQRAQVQRNLQKAPRWLKPLFATMFEDPLGFRLRVLTALPKMIFCLVPLFALILGLFFRRRPYMQHLTFALHLHAVLFLVFTIPQVAAFTRSPTLVGTLAAVCGALVLYYVLRSLRVVYGGGWIATLAKAAGVGMLYLLLWVPGMAAVIAWASIFR